jgi:L,D-peptidoglycan transpeptidase YkuD (ErfK/YbiS/YcfS/YnhG family)
MTRFRPVGLVVAVLALAGCGSAAPAAVRHTAITTPATTTPVPTAPMPTTPAPTTAPVATSTTALPASSTTITSVAPTTSTTTSMCPASVANQLASTGSAAQLVVVEAPTYAGTTASLTRWQRTGSCWTQVGTAWVAQLAWNGFSDHHQEGDDTTPTGAYVVGPVMYGTDPNPGVSYPYHQLVCGDWWDEDAASPDYNTFQHVACGAEPPFGGGSEPLWQEGNAYPSMAVIDYNTDPAIPGAGSGIFLHANIGTPTDGCVSLPLDQLDQVLEWLQPSDDPLVVLGPASEIEQF